LKFCEKEEKFVYGFVLTELIINAKLQSKITRNESGKASGIINHTLISSDG